jgi:hypothetical protein
MPHDKRRLDGLPIARQTRRIRTRIFRPLSAGQSIQFGVGRQQTALGINLPHLDPAPEAPESQPGLALLVDDQIGIDGVEIVFHMREQDQALVDPVEIGTAWVERLVR